MKHNNERSTLQVFQRALASSAVIALSAVLVGCVSAEPDNSSETEQSPVEKNIDATQNRVKVENAPYREGGAVYDFSYRTKNGTDLTCIIYDAKYYRAAAGGIYCFEEDVDGGGMIAPKIRPNR